MRLFSSLIAFLLFSTSATFSAECDCSRRVGTCNASGHFAGERIYFSAATPKCAQIFYYVDGQPGSVTIKGGSGNIDYFKTNKSERHELTVDSCLICKDPGEQECRAADPTPCLNKCTDAMTTTDDYARGGKGDMDAAIRAMRAAGVCFEACIAESNIRRVSGGEKAGFETCE